MFPNESAPAAHTAQGAGNEHWQALGTHSTTGREALLNRLCIDGGHTAALALRTLRAESPTLADPIFEHFARQCDDIDELLLSLGDAAVRAPERREAA